VSRLGDRGQFASICQPSYDPPIVSFTNRIATAIGPCLEGDIDTTDVDSNNPGTQLACTISGVPVCAMQGPDTPDPASPQPCYWISSNPTCGTASDLMVKPVGFAAPFAITCDLK
jgi:hypothetical protein